MRLTPSSVESHAAQNPSKRKFWGTKMPLCFYSLRDLKTPKRRLNWKNWNSNACKRHQSLWKNSFSQMEGNLVSKTPISIPTRIISIQLRIMGLLMPTWTKEKSRLMRVLKSKSRKFRRNGLWLMKGSLRTARLKCTITILRWPLSSRKRFKNCGTLKNKVR